ncbi:hypothetical protein, partial [Ferrimicrobium sp.]|uniref:hypothetical protein n=1 Tax=Ferrimicrobium sp. TaxID=2926050 RepID=UPI002628C44B
RGERLCQRGIEPTLSLGHADLVIAAGAIFQWRSGVRQALWLRSTGRVLPLALARAQRLGRAQERLASCEWVSAAASL